MNPACLLSALIVALLIQQVSPHSAFAQDPMASRDVNRVGYVAVIDMQKLLTDYRPFTDRIEALRKAEQQRMKLIASHVDLSIRKRGRLDKYRTGTVQHNHLSNEIRLLEAHIEVEEKTLEHAMRTAEAKLLVAFHKAVMQKIEEFANDKQITLVLNRPPDSGQVDSLSDAQALFERKVVYENNMDITNNILDALDDGAKKVPPVFSPPPFVMPDPVVLPKEVKP